MLYLRYLLELYYMYVVGFICVYLVLKKIRINIKNYVLVNDNVILVYVWYLMVFLLILFIFEVVYYLKVYDFLLKLIF